jgi:regulator of sigma E protease
LQVADTKTIPPFIAPILPPVIDSVTAGSPAQIAGINKGDQLLSIDDFKFTTWNEFALEMSRRNDILATGNAEDSLRLSHITITVARANSQTIDTLQVKFNSDYQFGFYMRNAAIDYETVTRQYSFLESIPAGIDRAVNTLSGYVCDLKYVFTAEGASSIGSFGTIGNLFPATWDWQRFWSLTAFISLILAVMNILPIPALDGGHVFFLLVEIILRRKPSDAFMERAQMFGMILLFGLMALALFNDCSNFGVFDIFK